MSKPQVTITLGRSGQVVKRILKTSAAVDARPFLGSKQPQYMAGSVSMNHPKNKRKRADGSVHYLGFNGVNDSNLGKNDLRLKLMRKKLSRQIYSGHEYHSKMDLRENTSRTAQPPVTGVMQQFMVEPKVNRLFRRIPHSRSPGDLVQHGSLEKSHSSWTVAGLRSTSPDRTFRTRGISPTRNVDELRKVHSMRPTDVSRTGRFLRKGAVVHTRPTGQAPIMMKSAQLPATGGIQQKSLYGGVEPLTVARLLHSLGLRKYSTVFRAAEVDMAALRQMGEDDLKELGIPMGPRKKILLSVLALSKRRRT